MEKGESFSTNILLKFLNNDDRQYIEEYVLISKNESYIEFKSKEDLKNNFFKLIEEFLSKLDQEDLLILRSYTGYNFKNINAILRNNWTYEENGFLDENTKLKYLDLANKVQQLLKKFPNPKCNFTTYRGTTLSSFKKYGVDSLNDLLFLKNKYIYEEGFTSTSIIEDSCYFNKNLETGKNYNVEIKYLMTEECNEGALLIDNNLTYSLSQNEFLINKGSLSKVIDVEINEKENTAILTVVVIPEKMWNLCKIEDIKQK